MVNFSCSQLGQYFPNFNMNMNHFGILLKGNVLFSKCLGGGRTETLRFCIFISSRVILMLLAHRPYPEYAR